MKRIAGGIILAGLTGLGLINANYLSHRGMERYSCEIRESEFVKANTPPKVNDFFNLENLLSPDRRFIARVNSGALLSYLETLPLNKDGSVVLRGNGLREDKYRKDKGIFQTYMFLGNGEEGFYEGTESITSVIYHDNTKPRSIIAKIRCHQKFHVSNGDSLVVQHNFSIEDGGSITTIPVIGKSVKTTTDLGEADGKPDILVKNTLYDRRHLNNVIGNLIEDDPLNIMAYTVIDLKVMIDEAPKVFYIMGDTHYEQLFAEILGNVLPVEVIDDIIIKSDSEGVRLYDDTRKILK